MKYGNLFNVPLGVPITGAPKKHIAAALAGMVGGYLSGAVQNSMQAESTAQNMKLQSRLNREEMNHSMQLQRAQQEWLMNRQYQATVSGMKNAGLNPATANGVSPAIPSGGSPHSGSSGPSAGMPNIDLVGSAVAAMNAEKDMDIKDAQKKNIDANTEKVSAEKNKIEQETDDLTWRNSDRVRQLRLQGWDYQNALLYEKANTERSNVRLNDQKVNEIAQNIDESASRIGLNEQMTKNYKMEFFKSIFQIAEICQNMKESEARIQLHRATARCQSSLAHLHDMVAQGQQITNEDLKATFEGKKSVRIPILGANGKPMTKDGKPIYHNYWENQAWSQGNQSSIQTTMDAYALTVLTEIPPEKRAEMQFMLQVIDSVDKTISATGSLIHGFGF